MNENRDVAIVGLSCRFPGAPDAGAFWGNLRNGVDSITEIPKNRWDWLRTYSKDVAQPGKSLSKWGGFLDAVDGFDAGFFNISPREARHMDPQQRLVLEEAWHCMENACLPPAALRSRRTSVYVGVMAMDYHETALTAGAPIDSYSCAGIYGCMLANRISFHYGLTGASLALDTACSSSLVALDLACKALEWGDCDFALVAGVSLDFNPFKYVSFSKARMLSPDGKCKTFDAAANGYVPGEGVGVVLLQRKKEAMAEGNRIMGLVKGTAVNHNGRTPSLTAPSLQAQKDLILRAHASAGIDPETVSYVEAHGTGTSLGDPIEVEALTQAFRRSTGKKGYCGLGSVKTNIGHLEAAAGIAGLTKVLLMFEHRQIPPSLNLETPNPVLSMEETPFEVTRELRNWEAGPDAPLRAGVSSFGFGGANAHVVLEEAPAALPSAGRVVPNGGSAHPFVLSARNAGSLRALLGKWKRFLEDGGVSEAALPDACASLVFGREHFPVRFAGLAGTPAEAAALIEKGLEPGFQALPTAPGNRWSLRIGRMEKSAIRSFFREFGEDAEVLALVGPGLASAQAADSRISSLREMAESADAPAAAGRLLEFWVTLFLARKLAGAAPVPGLVGGEGPGSLACLVLSGALEAEDACRVLLSEETGGTLANAASGCPHIACYDPVLGAVLQPWRVDAAYVKELYSALAWEDAEFLRYLDKGELLAKNQHTFRKYHEEWCSTLGDKAERFSRFWETGFFKPIGATASLSEKSLLLIMILYSLRKTHKKWSMDGEPVRDQALAELLDLLLDNVLLPEDVNVLFLTAGPDWGKAARAMESRQDRLDPSKPYVLLRNRSRKIAQAEAAAVPARVCAWEQLRVPVMPFATHISLEIGKLSEPGHPSMTATLFPEGEWDECGNRRILQAALGLWSLGLDIQWDKLYAPGAYRKMALPVYAFDRKSFWLGRENETAEVSKAERLEAEADLPGALARTFDCSDTVVRDHRIAGSLVIPGAALIEMAVEMSLRLQGKRPDALERITIKNPGLVGESLKTKATLADQGRIEISGGGKILVSARIASGLPPPAGDRPVWPAVSGELADIERFYRMMSERGYGYGQSLRVIRSIRITPSHAVCELSEGASEEGKATSLSPFLLDGIFQAALLFSVFEPDASDDGGLYVPFFIKSLQLPGKLSGECRVFIPRAGLRKGKDELQADLFVFDRIGNPTLRVEGMTFKRISRWGKTAPKDMALTESAEPSLSFYHPMWVASHAPSATAPAPFSGLSLILDGQGILGSRLEEALAERREQVIRAPYAGTLPSLPPERLGRDELRIFFLVPYRDGREPGQPEELRAQLERGIMGLFKMIQAMGAARIRNPLRLMVVTRDAQVVDGWDSGFGFASGAMHGFGRVLMAENRKLVFQSLDFGGTEISEAACVRAILDELGNPLPATLAFRRGGRYRQDVIRFDPPAAPASTPYRSGATYVIVGGGGGIGLKLCSHIAGKAAVNLVVVGRSEPNAGQLESFREMEKGGTRLLYLRCDVADAAQTEKGIAFARSKFGAIHGIFHCAGILEDRLLPNKQEDSFRRVLAPKIQGAWNLDQLTRKDPLDFFVVFSSIVSVIGNAGQSDYAAANAFLDSFAQYREKHAPGKTLAINWTLWADGGMGTDAATVQQLGRSRLHPISSKQAFPAMEASLVSPHAQVILLDARSDVFGSEIGPEIEPKSEKQPEEAQPEAVQMNSPDESPALEDMVVKIVAEVVSMAPRDLDRDIPFQELGVDSLAIMEIVARLEPTFPDGIHHSSLMEHPTIRKFSGFLSGLTRTNAALPKVPQVLTPAAHGETVLKVEFPREAASGKIAVIGVACRFPQSPSPEAFWENLWNGRDLVKEVGGDRAFIRNFFNPTMGAQGRTYSKWAALLDDVDAFDAGYFRIPDEMAADIDPQQRIFLELTQELLDGAGYSRNDLAGSSTGLFIGGHESEYGRKQRGRNKFHGRNGIVNQIPNMIAGRVSDYFDFHGPAEMIYTACSSSLVAIHNACQKLRAGECDLAVAGGIELLLDEEWFLGFSQGKVLSPDGKCRVFDENANGFVLGEGAGAVMLKSLENALRDGNQVLGVILGSATNNDGSTMGLTTPNLEAQKQVIRKALRASGVDAATVSYYEAHGTGTALGDPIEIKAATQVYREFTQANGYCPVGSVKSNMGHSLAAAGVASFIKVLLSLVHRRLPPTLHCNSPHRRFNFGSSPFFPAVSGLEWNPSAGIRRAAISSFGFGGTNCHMLMEEFDAKSAAHVVRRPPLPPTAFMRKTYSLGYSASQRESALRELFQGVAEGKIGAEQAFRGLHFVQDTSA